MNLDVTLATLYLQQDELINFRPLDLMVHIFLDSSIFCESTISNP
jgi:hypothetical protein